MEFYFIQLAGNCRWHCGETGEPQQISGLPAVEGLGTANAR